MNEAIGRQVTTPPYGHPSLKSRGVCCLLFLLTLSPARANPRNTPPLSSGEGAGG
jgi:hypothetical protein